MLGDSTACRSSLTIEAIQGGAGVSIQRPSRPSGEPMSKSLTWQPGDPLLDLELEALKKTLEKFGGNQAQAARALDISYSGIKRKLKRFGIVAENPRGRPRLEKIG